MEKTKKNYFKYVILTAVLLIPFIYSFFYLKAYWDPYKEGNIDNIPVAIVNKDQGEKGNELIDSIKQKKKLKLSIISNEEAIKGLNEGNYYAIINIPENFTEAMKSAASNEKTHATITYSPNQKSNYLASQIINNVVAVVEKNLDNSVNSEIIKELSTTINMVPDKLQTISNGFGELQNGISALQSGSLTLSNGTTTLNNNFLTFQNGIQTLKEGAETLKNATNEFSNLNTNLNNLNTGINTLKNGSDNLTLGLNNYVNGVNNTLTYTQNLVDIIKATICPKVDAGNATDYEINMCQIAKGLLLSSPTTGNTTPIEYIKGSGITLTQGNTQINFGINEINNQLSALTSVETKIARLQTGIDQLYNGVNTIYDSSIQIQNGIHSLNNGALTLNNGLNTLEKSVENAKKELDTNIETTKQDITKLEGLSDYSKEPVQIKTEEVNKIESYGTAFSPFFISIALWVGCLMLLIVLYYDRENRFGILGIDNPNRMQKTFAYHGLATLSAIILGILLQCLLDFQITNIFLYYISIILTANAFMGIIIFLIGNFQDVGKFIALILLVLQLSASGGTFPIETVTNGFRWMHNFLPMTYTIRLIKESLISIEANLMSKNLLMILGIFLVFFSINILIDIHKQNKENKK